MKQSKRLDMLAKQLTQTDCGENPRVFISVDGGATFQVPFGKSKWTRADLEAMQARGNEIVTIELPANGR